MERKRSDGDRYFGGCGNGGAWTYWSGKNDLFFSCAGGGQFTPFPHFGRADRRKDKEDISGRRTLFSYIGIDADLPVAPNCLLDKGFLSCYHRAVCIFIDAAKNENNGGNYEQRNRYVRTVMLLVLMLVLGAAFSGGKAEAASKYMIKINKQQNDVTV